MQYDLAIIGDGVFGKAFLFEINKHVKKSQNFSIAHIFDEKLAPACSLRTTSTVTLNGITEGLTDLGNDLSNAFYSFKEFEAKEKMKGIAKCKQFIIGTTDKKIAGLKRRFGNDLIKVESQYIIGEHLGAQLDSFIISPEIFLDELDKKVENLKIDKLNFLVKDIYECDNLIHLKLFNNQIIKAAKVVIATGAYSRIFTSLFSNTDFNEEILKTKIVAGSYLIKKCNFDNDIYLSLNGHNLIYRKSSCELIIGSTSAEGAIAVPDILELKNIFNTVNDLTTLDIGVFEDFEIVTGLRHKGWRRKPSFCSINKDKSIWLFNGGYKNGWSLPFYYIKRDISNFI